MRIPRKRILKYLIIFSILTLVVAASKNHAPLIRIRSIDLSAPSLRSFNKTVSAVKKLIPFASLRDENALLRNEIDLLKRKLEEAKPVYEENRRLKELLNYAKTLAYTTIPAQVIGRDPTNWSNSLIIDKGLMHGIRPNRAVLSPKGLVGRIIEIGKYSSKILLITDPGSKVGITLQKTGQGGILIGRPDGKCKMIYIALDAEVHPGDKVMTAGLSSIFPKGVLVGEVVGVGKEPGRLYKYAVVKPAQDFSRLEEVLCIR
ncbi:MAG: rod shape-determining protein MreC [Candidatus Omnitrophica bacterium]|nr:rod shape-determining protein MreC [Candidatus Omnitrophota bacterium]